MDIMLNGDELNKIKGLLHYLNTSFGEADLDVVVTITTDTCDVIGCCKRSDGGDYQFFPGLIR